MQRLHPDRTAGIARAAVILVSPAARRGPAHQRQRRLGWVSGRFPGTHPSAFAATGLVVAVVDAPSDRPETSTVFARRREHAATSKAVIAWLRGQVKVRCGLIAPAAARSPPPPSPTQLWSVAISGPDGIVLTSTILTDPRSKPRARDECASPENPGAWSFIMKKTAAGIACTATMPRLMDKTRRPAAQGTRHLQGFVQQCRRPLRSPRLSRLQWTRNRSGGQNRRPGSRPNRNAAVTRNEKPAAPRTPTIGAWAEKMTRARPGFFRAAVAAAGAPITVDRLRRQPRYRPMRSSACCRAKCSFHRNVANVVVHTDLNCLFRGCSSPSMSWACAICHRMRALWLRRHPRRPRQGKTRAHRQLAAFMCRTYRRNTAANWKTLESSRRARPAV